MYNNWNVDLSDSVKALEKIKDTVLPKIISGKIHCIEKSNDEILLLFDRISGVDYIRQNEHGLQGIAARVQWGFNYNTFTIRMQRKTGAKTELEKRIEQIKNGYIYPAYTLQAYFDNRKENNLLSIAIIKTIDLYTLYFSNPKLFRVNESDNIFLILDWYKVENLIKIYQQ
jgi:hypothetical protein